MKKNVSRVNPSEDIIKSLDYLFIYSQILFYLIFES